MSSVFRELNQDYIEMLRGPVADPAITMLLPKEMLAQIKVRQLEVLINQYQQQVEMLNLQVEMLRKEYRLK